MEIINDLGGSAGEGADDRARADLRDLIHKTNNYLGVVMTNAENALAKNDAQASRRALETILQQSEMLLTAIRDCRKKL
ncbi:MAG: hypothetical protein ACKVS6_14265 [Planctomycetota bacterium]